MSHVENDEKRKKKSQGGGKGGVLQSTERKFPVCEPVRGKLSVDSENGREIQEQERIKTEGNST